MPDKSPHVLVRDSSLHYAVGFAQVARRSENYKPLLASAMELALQGTVSLDEVMALGEGDASGKTDPIFM